MVRTAPSPRRSLQVAGIEPVGPDRHVGLRVEPLGFGERADRGLLARGIRIEGEDDLARRRVVAHDAAERGDVVGAEGGAAGGDRGGDAGQVAGHDVGVPLDDDDPMAAGDLALGEVEPVEHPGLLVERRLGGVEVLRPVVVVEQPAGAEADDLAGHIADRPDHAAAEAVVDAALALRDEPAGDELVTGEALRGEGVEHRRPALGGEADAEVRGSARVEPALAEEAAARCRPPRSAAASGRTPPLPRWRRTAACDRCSRARPRRPRSAARSRSARPAAPRPR